MEFQNLYFSLILCFFELVSCDNRNFTIVPGSKIVKVNTGRSLDVYFQVSSELQYSNHSVKCSYSSAPNISGSYTLQLTPPTKWNQSDDENDKGSLFQYGDDYFQAYDTRKVCGFTVRQVSLQVSKVWNLTVLDLKTNESYSETVAVQVYSNIDVLKSLLNVIQGASGMNYIPKPDNSTWIKCILQDKTNEDVEIDLLTTDSKILPNVSFASKLSALGHGVCGFRIINADSSDNGKITMVAQDTKNIYRTNFDLVVMKKEKISDGHQGEALVVLGDVGATITCGQSELYGGSQSFCYLYDPKGNFVLKDRLCRLEMPIVRHKDLGDWRCRTANEFMMSTVDFTTSVKEQKEEPLQQWSRDEGDIHSFGCNVTFGHTPSKLSNILAYCKFISPDGKLFKVEYGSATDRYTSMRTNLGYGICGMEIWKPLTKEEQGTWRCEGHSSVTGGGQIGGAYVDVITKSSSINVKRTLQRDVKLREPFLIECSIPRSSHHCYLLSPNGTYYRSTVPDRITLGECAFEIKKVTDSDLGNWTCFFASETLGEPDEEIKLELSLTLNTLSYADVEVTEGNTANLVCNTDEVPLQQCIFQSPQGKSYNMRPSSVEISPNARTSYHGRGLNFGDCGIKIQKSEKMDEGNWICHLETQKSHVRQQVALTVTGQGMGLAGSLGIALGSIVAIAVIAGFGYFTYYLNRKKKMRQENLNQEVRYDASRASLDSDEAVRSIILPSGGPQNVPFSIYNAINKSD